MSNGNSAVAEPTVTPKRRARPDDNRKQKRQPRYNVILWNDEEHSFEYVIVMLLQLFGHPPERGFQLAREVDTQGCAVVLTTTREHAELKRDQIHAFGKDDLVSECLGSMWATIEPVPEG